MISDESFIRHHINQTQPELMKTIAVDPYFIAFLKKHKALDDHAEEQLKVHYI